MVAKVLAHREEEIPSLCEARNDVPGALDRIFARMIAKNPKERYQSMTILLADLEVLAGQLEDEPRTSRAPQLSISFCSSSHCQSAERETGPVVTRDCCLFGELLRTQGKNRPQQARQKPLRAKKRTFDSIPRCWDGRRSSHRTSQFFVRRP